MPKLSAVPDVSVAKELAAAAKALAPAARRIAAVAAGLDAKRLPQGAAADLLYDLEQVGKQLSTLLAPFTDALGPAIKAVEEHFIQTLSVGESSGVQGMRSRVQVTDAVIPTVEDWDKFYAYIAKKKAFELLNKAVNRKAVAERWDAKEQVPGVGRFIAKRVSCTKLGGKGGGK